MKFTLLFLCVVSVFGFSCGLAALFAEAVVYFGGGAGPQIIAFLLGFMLGICLSSDALSKLK